ncbi:MAG: hypothetical protein AB7T49_12125 [Oligoflexales bacterium]
MMTLIEKICGEFAKEKIPYAIVGGFAVALHGAVRGTIDIDIITNIALENFEKIESSLKRMGFASRLPVVAREVFSFREEYIKNRNLIAWSFYNTSNPTEVVDVIITHDLKNFKTAVKEFRGHKLVILAIDDLMAMKEESGRPQDLLDIAALRKLKK